MFIVLVLFDPGRPPGVGRPPDQKKNMNNINNVKNVIFKILYF